MLNGALLAGYGVNDVGKMDILGDGNVAVMSGGDSYEHWRNGGVD